MANKMILVTVPEIDREIEAVETPDGRAWAIISRLCERFRFDSEDQVPLGARDGYRTAWIDVPDASGKTEKKQRCLALECVSKWHLAVQVNRANKRFRAHMARQIEAMRPGPQTSQGDQVPASREAQATDVETSFERHQGTVLVSRTLGQRRLHGNA